MHLTLFLLCLFILLFSVECEINRMFNYLPIFLTDIFCFSLVSANLVERYILELKAPLGHQCHIEHVKAQVREAFVTS